MSMDLPTPPLPYTETTSGELSSSRLWERWCPANTRRSSASDSVRPVKCAETGGHWSGGRQDGPSPAAGFSARLPAVAQVSRPTRRAASTVTPTLASVGRSQTSSDVARMLATAAAIPAAAGAASEIDRLDGRGPR